MEVGRGREVKWPHAASQFHFMKQGGMRERERQTERHRDVPSFYGTLTLPASDSVPVLVSGSYQSGM